MDENGPFVDDLPLKSDVQPGFLRPQCRCGPGRALALPHEGLGGHWRREDSLGNSWLTLRTTKDIKGIHGMYQKLDMLVFKSGPWPYRIPKLWQVEPTMEVFQELMHVAAEAPGANDDSPPLTTTKKDMID